MVSIRSFQIPRSACLFKGSNGRNHHFWGIMFFFLPSFKTYFFNSKKTVGIQKTSKMINLSCHDAELIKMASFKGKKSRCHDRIFTMEGTLPKTNSKCAPENRPKPKRKQSYSNHPFSGAFAVSFREGSSFFFWKGFFFSPKRALFQKKRSRFFLEIQKFVSTS